MGWEPSNFGCGDPRRADDQGACSKATDVLTKTCTRCGATKLATLEFFHRLKAGKYGIQSICKTCLNKSRVEWRQENPERDRAAYNRYFYSHQEARVAQAAERRKAKPEQHRAATRRWNREHPEHKKHMDASRRGRKRGAPGTFKAADVKRQLLAQGNKCFWCKAELTEYHVDHVIPLSKGGTNWPSNIVCACPTCNLRKSDKMPDEFAKVIGT